MNAIIQMLHHKVMGSVIDAIEYFLVSYLYNSNSYLIIVHVTNEPHCNTYKDKLVSLINNRYDYPISSDIYSNNILVMNQIQLVRTKLKTAVLLDWGTIPRIRGLVNSDNTIIISELSDDVFMLDKNKYNNLSYYGEMPFVYKDYQYNMKFAFDFYRKIPDDVEIPNNVYINAPDSNAANSDITKNKEIMDYLNNHSELKDKSILMKSTKHLNNMFHHFNSYLYYNTGEYFDPHPRLFHECYFYGKKLYYENPKEIKDGSYYRWNDLQVNGLKNRVLDKNDEIIQVLMD